jgi:hypothetical protein
VIYSAWPQAVETLMNDLVWFQTQLEASSAGFAWAVAQVPAERQEREPPAALGPWSAARHIFHLLFYEREVALPNWNLWLGHSLNLEAVVPDEDIAWDSRAAATALLAQWQEGRAALLALLPQFADSAWSETRPAVWGEVTLRWVVSKTYQHTAQHIHEVLALALDWDLAGAQPRRR